MYVDRIIPTGNEYVKPKVKQQNIRELITTTRHT